jgi:LysR family nitrogen assimilation transcriptional regulator
MHLAQSALSRRVQRLEQSLGVTLLERHPRGVTATKAGELLISRAHKVQAQLRQIENEMRLFANSPPLEASIAMPQGVARSFTTPAAERFHKQCPQVRLRVVERESAHNRASVIAGAADFALAYNAQPHPDLVQLPLLHERIFVIAAAPPSAGQTPPASYGIADLERLPLILPSAAHGFREVLRQAAGRDDFAPNIIMELDGFAASLEMVQRGLGYSVSTYPLVQSSVEAGKLVCIPIDAPGCEVTLSLLYRRDRPLAPFLQDLKDIIQDVAHAIEPTPYWRKA